MGGHALAVPADALLVGVAFLPKSACILGLLVLALADPVAGAVGRRWGRRRLYRDKSVIGTAAFFLTALLLAVVGLAIDQPAMGWAQTLGAAAVIALAGALAELMGEHVPDNFSVLVVTGTVAMLVT